jgi:hypothetical protein
VSRNLGHQVFCEHCTCTPDSPCCNDAIGDPDKVLVHGDVMGLPV